MVSVLEDFCPFVTLPCNLLLSLKINSTRTSVWESNCSPDECTIHIYNCDLNYFDPQLVLSRNKVPFVKPYWGFSTSHTRSLRSDLQTPKGLFWGNKDHLYFKFLLNVSDWRTKNVFLSSLKPLGTYVPLKQLDKFAVVQKGRPVGHIQENSYLGFLKRLSMGAGEGGPCVHFK